MRQRDSLCVYHRLHSDLSSPLPDYKALAQLTTLAPADKKIVKSALATLPSLITAEREKEMGDMMGKLKEVSKNFLILHVP